MAASPADRPGFSPSQHIPALAGVKPLFVSTAALGVIGSGCSLTSETGDRNAPSTRRLQSLRLWAESPQYDSLGCSEHRERRPRKQSTRLCARPEGPEQSTHSHPVSRSYRTERIVWASSPGASRLALHPRLSHRGPSALQIVQSRAAGWKACATRSEDILIRGFGRLSCRAFLTHF